MVTLGKNSILTPREYEEPVKAKKRKKIVCSPFPDRSKNHKNLGLRVYFYLFFISFYNIKKFGIFAKFSIGHPKKS